MKAGALPSLSGNAGYNRAYFQGTDAVTSFGDNYSAGLFLRWPVFTGFQKSYDARRAEEDAKAAEELVRLAQQYGSFMLRNALALAVALHIEDGAARH